MDRVTVTVFVGTESWSNRAMDADYVEQYRDEYIEAHNLDPKNVTFKVVLIVS